jgi:dephospho-CoA kinase
LKTIGLTGGIGSGKSTVAGFFKELGVPVFIADEQARELVNTSPEIRLEIETLLGSEAYRDDQLDRSFVADRVFGNAELLDGLNQIIHPRVRTHFAKWKEQQNGPYCIMEAAILFENGGFKLCDRTILVTAPEELRIQRVIKRDGVSKEEVKARMGHQWPDTKKKKLANYTIENIDLKATRKMVWALHEKLAATP